MHRLISLISWTFPFQFKLIETHTGCVQEYRTIFIYVIKRDSWIHLFFVISIHPSDLKKNDGMQGERKHNKQALTLYEDIIHMDDVEDERTHLSFKSEGEEGSVVKSKN